MAIASVRRWWRRTGTQIFGADLRSLAIFRIVVAVLALCDLAVRFTNLRAHYADAGILPRELLLDAVQLNEWRWSVFLASGTLPFQAAVFGIGAVAALAMLLGWRTRLATIVLWVVILSIHARNPYLNTGGDNLLRLMLFWSIFLPLGARWSHDARHHKIAPGPQPFVSFGTVAIFLQIAIMYWMTAYLKSGDAWHADGTAIHYALGLGHYVRSFGTFLWQFPDLLHLLTVTTIWLEWLAPFLLFSPILTGPVRTAAAAALMSLHLGIWLTLDIGIFPWIAGFSMVCFLPSWFWDSLVPRAGRVTRSLPRSVIPDLLVPHPAPVGGAQPVGGGDHDEGHDVATEAGPSPRSDAPPWQHVTLNVLAALSLVYVMMLNARTVSAFRIPEPIRPVEHALYLRQNWAMFAPEPSRASVWYILPGTLANGDRIDVLPALIHDDMSMVRALSLEPGYLAFENKQWRQYLSSLRSDRTVDRRVRLATYACREWNTAHTGEWRLESVQYGVVREPTLAVDDHGPPRQVLSDPIPCA